jgi:hypothetical protein
MEGHRTLLQIKRENDARRKAKYKVDSKERLKKIASTKIRTTMIGALDSIEKHLGYLWEDNEELREIYEIVRQEILDRGNDQIRGLNSEMDHYDIEWLRYQLKLNVRSKQENE